MNKIINYGYEDGINDAFYDILTQSYHYPEVNDMEVYSKVYDYYYTKGYRNLIMFILNLIE